jgi:hypothetical protein
LRILGSFVNRRTDARLFFIHFAAFIWHEGYAVSQKPPPIIVHVINPAAFSGQGSSIMLELADESAAVEVARKIAHETGRAVTVRDADKKLIETIPAGWIH